MSEGLHYDQGKTRWDLLPFDALNEVAKVGTVGTDKYPERNWERGLRWSKIVGSLMRHLYARMSGERIDPESGLPHLAHFVWRALVLLSHDLRDIGENDIGECAGGPKPSVTDEPSYPIDAYCGPSPDPSDINRGRVTTKEVTAVFDDLAEANPEDEPYEGVTREEGRLGCSFLQGLYQFGAKR